MNFFDNVPPYQINNGIPLNNQINPNDIMYNLNEINNKIRKLEQRITRLESNSSNIQNQNQEPDNSLYMI